MTKLIIKNGYIKGGNKKSSHLSHLVKYVATRDGVEKNLFKNENTPVTIAQKKLIENLIKDYPNCKNSYEYEDFKSYQTAENASEFITQTLEQFVYPRSDNEKYLGYIANRPRVEIIDTHGLFNGSDNKIVLSQVAEEISLHDGNVWTPIISLRREDADRTDYQTASAWKSLISSKVFEIAESMKIHPNNFRWYGAFHNESHHPHVHLICYSTDSSEGYLNKNGIEKMKSTLANEIFKQELTQLYSQKTIRRDELKKQAKEAFQELQNKIISGDFSNPQLEKYITELAVELQTVKGKKQYGYLQSHAKKLVDNIVDELSKQPQIQKSYELWCELQDELCNFYRDSPPDHPLLSQHKEFKSIKNMVIQEVLQINLEQVQNISKTAEFILKVSENMKDQKHYFCDNDVKNDSTTVGFCALRLLNQLGKIFDEKFTTDSTTTHQHSDQKQRRKSVKKKLSLGQKIAEEQENIEQRFTL